MKLIHKLLLIAFVLGFAACQDLTKLDGLQDNPNAVSPDKAGINFLYNQIQLSFNGFFGDTRGLSASVARELALQATNYSGFGAPSAYDGIWQRAYSTLFPDMDACIEIAEASDLKYYSGTVKVMKAYVMMCLVDLFGDVTYSEAGQGTDIISPKVDPGKDVYAAALALLDEGITDLSGGANAPTSANDFFYNGNSAKWTTLAKTLKLRAYVTTRLVDTNAKGAITNLIQGGDLIDQASEDFQFTYGTNRTNPNTRHPFYNNWYETSDGDYMSNYYMWLLRGEKRVDGDPIIDPRIRFYFYRQDIDLTDENVDVWGCQFSQTPVRSAAPAHYLALDPDMPYCITSEDGYFGRDHGNGSGIPPDGNVRTAYGIYPGGGRWDDDSAELVQESGTLGALGKGINPIMLSSFVDFMRAEAALTVQTGEDARALLQSGIEKSFAKVIDGSRALIPHLSQVAFTDFQGNDVTYEKAYFPTEDDRTNYINFVLDEYDNAASESAKLNIIMKEYLIALWGNGIEAYNNYRRTGKPEKAQPMLEASATDYPRSALYPSVLVNRNANVAQKANRAVQVFWDTNPATGFVY